uniref:uncharacterized protein LOC122592767 n=1 Tax=Erigeron canadensis TaxID=72917 RepID=UPI001CB93A90|nr:uncharacterized protein LOC122592767 [Erigeron canadensis]
MANMFNAFTGSSGSHGLTLMAILIYFYVNWSLAFVVVVVESKWGLAPLMRSSYLVKGMRPVSLLVILYFAFVVAVVESKWGFASLTRSAYLVKGMRLVSLKLILIYGALGGMIVFVYSRSLEGYGLMTGWGVFNTLFGSSFLMMFLMQSVVANVVLYNYCRALHGELAIEVDGGFLNEYVCLSADDEKVPHVVTVVTV